MNKAASKKKRVVGYVRVSVDSPDKVSPEIQAEAIQKLCNDRGWELVHTEIERGRSAGEGKKRPGLDRVRGMIRRGEADTLVVWKLDRCSRSVLDFSGLLTELQKQKADFVSCTESFDTSSAIGEVLIYITMVFAQFERRRMGERATAFQSYRAQQGEPPSTPLLGYRKVGKHLVIDEEAGPVVKQAVELFLATRNVNAVARHLRDSGYPRVQPTISRLLCSPTLAGLRLADGVKIQGNWPAIIDIDTHDQVNAVFRGRGRGRPTYPRLLLSSIAVCGRCGSPMMSGGPERRDPRHFHRYQCSSGFGIPKPPPVCRLSIYQPHLDRYVEDQLLAYLTPAKWERMRAGRRAAAPVVDTVALEADLAHLAEDWAHGKITKGEWDAARTVLLTRIDDAGSVDDDDVELPDVTDLHKAWRTDKLPTEEKRLVISAVIDQVIVKPAFLIPGRKNGWAPVDDRAKILWR